LGKIRKLWQEWQERSLLEFVHGVREMDVTIGKSMVELGNGVNKSFFFNGLLGGSREGHELGDERMAPEKLRTGSQHAAPGLQRRKFRSTKKAPKKCITESPPEPTPQESVRLLSKFLYGVFQNTK
jgi:hypothetical protein